MLILIGMTVVIIAGFGVLGALVPVVAFMAAKARFVDVVLAAVGYGGTSATIVSMGPYYKEGPYLFVPLAILFTAAWVLATVRVVHYRGPLRWRWQNAHTNAEPASEIQS